MVQHSTAQMWLWRVESVFESPLYYQELLMQCFVMQVTVRQVMWVEWVKPLDNSVSFVRDRKHFEWKITTKHLVDRREGRRERRRERRERERKGKTRYTDLALYHLLQDSMMTASITASSKSVIIKQAPPEFCTIIQVTNTSDSVPKMFAV